MNATHISNAHPLVLQVIHHIALPIFIFYYVMKAAQLIFVFEWTTAKAEHNMEKVVTLFHKECQKGFRSYNLGLGEHVLQISRFLAKSRIF